MVYLNIYVQVICLEQCKSFCFNAVKYCCPVKTRSIMNIPAPLSCIFLFFFTGLPSPSHAEWLLFRGNNEFNGHSDQILPDKPHVHWTFRTDGPVLSSAVIHNNRVYIGSDDHHVYCINLSNGNEIWKYKTGDSIEAPPSILHSTLIVGSNDMNVYALDPENGSLLWKYSTGNRIVGAANATTFIKCQDSSLTGTGTIIGSHDNHLYHLKLSDGSVRWKYLTDNYINGAPAIWKNHAVFGGCDAKLHMVNIETGFARKPIEIGSFIAGTVAIEKNRAYIGHYDNAFLCIELEERRILWEYRFKAFPFFSSAAIGDDRIVFGGRDQRLHCVNKADGRMIWRFKARGKIDSSPVICNDRVAAASNDGRVYVLSLADGSEIWSYETGGPIAGSPAVSSGKLVIGSENGMVYAFGSTRGNP